VQSHYRCSSMPPNCESETERDPMGRAGTQLLGQSWDRSLPTSGTEFCGLPPSLCAWSQQLPDCSSSVLCRLQFRLCITGHGEAKAEPAVAVRAGQRPPEGFCLDGDPSGSQ
jgi:hypothetical protein